MSDFDGLEDALRELPPGFRVSVGHVPHWYRRDELPKNLRRKQFEAYVLNDNRLLGTKAYIFESSDAGTPAEAVRLAIAAAKKAALSMQPGNKS